MTEPPKIVPCYKCGADSKLGAHVCKNCRAHFPGRNVRKPFLMHLTRVVYYGGGGFLVLMIAGSLLMGLVNPTATSSGRQTSRAATEYHEFGFQCLDRTDGSHRAFKREVRASMRSPSSFKHITTRVVGADQNGNHKLIMTYSAENGFGGTNVETATGEFNRKTCEHRIRY